MLYNLKTHKWLECYYRKLDKDDVQEYVPPNWVFDFTSELNDNFEVFGLETKEYPGIVQGIVALRVNKHEYTVHLKSAESADINKYFIHGLKRNGLNPDRIYKGIGVNLVAFACQYSLENDCDGHVNLISKSDTIPFYESIGGEPLFNGGQIIVFLEKAGQKLATEYFSGGAIQWLD